MKQPICDLIKTHEGNPLALLQAIGGYYETVTNEQGNCVTPLVGYAAKYSAPGGDQLQYVGHIYVNFAKAEESPSILSYFAGKLFERIQHGIESIKRKQDTLTFVGPQMGGIAIGMFLAHIALSYEYDAHFACAEKKTTQLATNTLREQSELRFARHTVLKGSKVIVAEDVLNNFSTTKETIEMVEDAGGIVVAIAGLLNRSIPTLRSYSYDGRDIPIISLVEKPYKEYTQEDPAVINDIAKGNVSLKPKDNWDSLMEQQIEMTNLKHESTTA